MTSRHAACSCGQLSATVGGEPIRVSVCHCLACQRRTGSIFGVQARYPRSAVVISGRSQAYVRRGESGADLTFHFCPLCGATVHYVLAAAPDIVGIPVGAFADPTFPAPQISFYEAHHHPWLSVLVGNHINR